MTVHFKHIERRKSRAIDFDKLLYFIVVICFKCYMTNQLDFEAKFLSVDLDILRLFFLNSEFR